MKKKLKKCTLNRYCPENSKVNLEKKQRKAATTSTRLLRKYFRRRKRLEKRVWKKLIQKCTQKG